MDRTGASFTRTVEMIVDRLKAVPAPIQLPIGAESSFTGIIDLIDEVAYMFHDEMGQNIERTEIQLGWLRRPEPLVIISSS